MSATNSPTPPVILAIDDEPELLDVIQRTLVDAGFAVITAGTGDAGLNLYELHRKEIKLVLLDYLLPDLQGDEVYDHLQRIDPDVRVILLTGCDDSVARSMFARGLRGYIAKPFYLDDLTERVREEIEAP